MARITVIRRQEVPKITPFDKEWVVKFGSYRNFFHSKTRTYTSLNKATGFASYAEAHAFARQVIEEKPNFWPSITIGRRLSFRK